VALPDIKLTADSHRSDAMEFFSVVTEHRLVSANPAGQQGR
jgi:hypothetical protein